MPDLPDPTQIAIPLFIGAILLELWVVRKRNRLAYDPQDTFTSLMLGLGSTVSGLLTGGFFFAAAMWLYQYRIFDIGFVWWAWPVAFVLDDLAYYWKHRLGHRMRWMWAAHVIHHSSQHYNLSTALRQTWTGFITPGFLISIPLFLLGFHPLLVAFCAGINLVYQFWIHTEAIDKMPRWFEAVMNTPSHHRVHHATNPRYLDSNYAGVFIIWDKMFGSFVPETDEEEIRYGIVKQLGSFNVLWAAFHEWIGIAQDMWHAPDWKARLNYLIRPPGWTHDNSRLTSDSIKARWQAERDEAGQGSPKPLSPPVVEPAE
ncbi:sterol desaturase family protein [Alterisphingorhabdus coralli]|uniref:Sterol desaturase family protein n=1 Tax=Alterisphingorhabdus coralli TaxID=3071408 RepID=A0AA97F9L9_9SPHN|nr:sterol desaturase family protein [Parasphingorhabdus sp. SCSIO 66989]WOE76691.1 sterol desaturase family protein [Parasphingorhabdus sp. SCSIO 66989]